MESPDHSRQTIGRWALWLMLCILLWAYYAQLSSFVIPLISQRARGSINLVLLTEPAMFVSYYPSTHRGNIIVFKNQKELPTIEQTAKKLLESEKIDAKKILIFEPQTKDRSLFEDNFAAVLRTWRYNPTLLWHPISSYILAYKNHKTNISPFDYWFLMQELMRLETSDFSIKEPLVATKKKGKNATPLAPVAKVQPITSADTEKGPLVVEILNASGKKGIAQELTQYLREESEKGLLRVDVLQYDNYSSSEDKSWIEDYSGRLVIEKQIGKAIGINNEIKLGTTPNVICEARIIVGKDFKMPH